MPERKSIPSRSKASGNTSHRDLNIIIEKLLNPNEINRQDWLKKKLTSLPKGLLILDAGAGELKNKKYCKHLEYISQDFCQYDGGMQFEEGLQTKSWDTSRIDIVSDITSIPRQDASFDVILCSEVLEHVPEPTHVLDEFVRLLKPGGKLIITAPFASLVHFAPYHYCTGFSRYWYEYHLINRNLEILEMTPNGDWFDYCRQELIRLGSASKKYGYWLWPFGYFIGMMGILFFLFKNNRTKASDLACFGWHCIAVKKSENVF